MGDPSVVVIVPVLRRPHRVTPLLESLSVATPEPHRLLFVASPDDVAEHQAVIAAGAELLVLDRPPGPGDYARKVNAAVAATTEPLLFLGADDLAFHSHWLERAVARVEGRVGVVGTNDLGNPRVLRGEHATHCLVTRRYVQRGSIDDHGRLLHEGYEHEYVDDELVGTAKHRRCWAFAADSIVEHLHPHWGKAPMDDLYAAQRERMRRSRKLFLQRRHLWM